MIYRNRFEPEKRGGEPNRYGSGVVENAWNLEKKKQRRPQPTLLPNGPMRPFCVIGPINNNKCTRTRQGSPMNGTTEEGPSSTIEHRSGGSGSIDANESWRFQAHQGECDGKS